MATRLVLGLTGNKALAPTVITKGRGMKEILDDCERFRAQLVSARDIDQISEIKKRIEHYGKELPFCGIDCEMAVAEVTRRAERALAQAIRRGQKAGAIHSLGGAHRGRTSVDRYLASGTTRIETYALADDVDDERFEQAISQARAEGDLRRANVLRKLRGHPSPPPKNRRNPEAPPQRSRKPIGVAMRDVSVEAMKVVHTIERLIRDERFSPSKIDPITKDAIRRSARLLSEAVESMNEGEA